MTYPKDPFLGRRVSKALLFSAGLLMVIAATLTYQGLVNEHIKISEGKGRRPGARAWHFSGEDARRIGFGGLALTLAAAMMLFNGILKGRTIRWWRFRVALAFLLFLVAALLMLPPWKMERTGSIAAFYTFLIPALAGVFSRSVGGVLVGCILGFGLAIAQGGTDALQGAIPGFITWLFIAPHLAFLISQKFREGFSEQ